MFQVSMADQLNNATIYLTVADTVIQMQNNDNDYQFLPWNVVNNRNEVISQLDVQQTDDHVPRRVNNLLYLYATGHGAIMTAVFSGGSPIGWHILWSISILSGLLSISIIAALLVILFEEFSRIRRGRELRNSVAHSWRWIARNASILGILMAFSICLFFSCTALLFSRIP